jgi:Protein of unknown function (DUF5132)
MSFLEDALKGNNIASGLAVGVGAMVVAPVVLPAVARLSKPLLKGVLKTGLLAYEAGRRIYAEVSEVAGDMLAEARSEMQAEAQHDRRSGVEAAAAGGEGQPGGEQPKPQEG